MDQYLSAVIIALITGVFSVITVLIQKKNNELIDKIDEQTGFIEREKKVKQSLNEKTVERNALVDEIILLILNTNVYALKPDTTIPPDVFTKSEELEAKFDALTKEIAELTKEYNLILDLSKEYPVAIKK